MLSLQTSAPTISRWKQRFEQEGIDGLDPQHKGSQPRVADAALQARIARKTQQKPARRIDALVVPEDGGGAGREQVHRAAGVGPDASETAPAGWLHGQQRSEIPSLMYSSSAIRSSPQVGFSRSISRISSPRFFGSGGRPRRRGFHCQNIRTTVRCHLMKVSGLTITRDSPHSKKRASAIIARRVALVIRRGFTLRSWNKASCLP
jgi:hypothetical protein